ncbi:MAG: DoxX family protein [Alphaproteobacteria bacterium]|nr:DoxX family protein [Alphaproteobacteria bacterium]MBV9420938.1 DoxX family protein [Alphaproteobacteria bacterium]MBV9541783.1 DoxX family protein [Alphaproteobacteria bacterium]MBV9905660.1 DoxX family protein [Alphaproteobacteria bacterium]
MAWLAKYQPQLLSILRIVVGLLFLEHGMQKLLGFPPMPAAMAHAIPPQMMPIIMAAGVIELVGGALVLIGLFTRIAAFICSGEMAAAYFMGHMARGGIFPAVNGGDAAILFCFVFLFIAAAGPGPWAVSRSTSL